MPHHITQRGNRKMDAFFREANYTAYLDFMRIGCDTHQVKIQTYCLMPNHVHLIAVPETMEGLAHAIADVHRRYTRYVNLREEWSGFLWQGRFSSCVMDNAHFLTAMRYIELNPVRAGLVKSPEEWRWSSARAHLTGEADSLLHNVVEMRGYIGDWEAYLALDIDEEIRRRIARHVRSGRPMGGQEFVAQLEKQLGRTLQKSKPGPKRNIGGTKLNSRRTQGT